MPFECCSPFHPTARFHLSNRLAGEGTSSAYPLGAALVLFVLGGTRGVRTELALCVARPSCVAHRSVSSPFCSLTACSLQHLLVHHFRLQSFQAGQLVCTGISRERLLRKRQWQWRRGRKEDWNQNCWRLAETSRWWMRFEPMLERQRNQGMGVFSLLSSLSLHGQMRPIE